MEQEVGGLARIEAAGSREGERVDPEQRRVVALADQRLQPRDHARAPGARRLELRQPLVERPLVDHRCHA